MSQRSEELLKRVADVLESQADSLRKLEAAPRVYLPGHLIEEVRVWARAPENKE